MLFSPFVDDERATQLPCDKSRRRNVFVFRLLALITPFGASSKP
jgi:hypothetical protein